MQAYWVECDIVVICVNVFNYQLNQQHWVLHILIFLHTMKSYKILYLAAKFHGESCA